MYLTVSALFFFFTARAILPCPKLCKDYIAKSANDGRLAIPISVEDSDSTKGLAARGKTIMEFETSVDVLGVPIVWEKLLASPIKATKATKAIKETTDSVSLLTAESEGTRVIKQEVQSLIPHFKEESKQPFDFFGVRIEPASLKDEGNYIKSQVKLVLSKKDTVWQSHIKKLYITLAESYKKIPKGRAKPFLYECLWR